LYSRDLVLTQKDTLLCNSNERALKFVIDGRGSLRDWRGGKKTQIDDFNQSYKVLTNTKMGVEWDSN